MISQLNTRRSCFLKRRNTLSPSKRQPSHAHVQVIHLGLGGLDLTAGRFDARDERDVRFDVDDFASRIKRFERLALGGEAGGRPAEDVECGRAKHGGHPFQSPSADSAGRASEDANDISGIPVLAREMLVALNNVTVVNHAGGERW